MSSSPVKSSRLNTEGITAGGGLPLADLARLRQGVYRLLASVLLYPDREWWETIPPLAGALVEETGQLMAFAFWGEWERLLIALQDLSESDRKTMETVYTKELLMNDPSEGCSPYESVYVKREDVAWLMGELDGIYAKDGFSVSPSSGQMPDHASVQLEFMSLLCSQEAEAWAEENSEEAARLLGRQEQFLRTHLGDWFPRFASSFQAKKPGHFYSLGCQSVGSYLAHELDLLPQFIERFEKVTLK